MNPFEECGSRMKELGFHRCDNSRKGGVEEAFILCRRVNRRPVAWHHFISNLCTIKKSTFHRLELVEVVLESLHTAVESLLIAQGPSIESPKGLS